MKIYEGKYVPIKSWCDNPEEGSLEQAQNLASLPFIFRQVCLMPDVHQGYGMPVGGVIATKGTIIPNAVGVDIGCGMCAVRTELLTDEIVTDNLKIIMQKIREFVPLGFNHHKEKQEWIGFNDFPPIPIIQREIQSAQYQLGTLGGGNHFIEIQKGSDGFVWIMLHSGSRNFGLKIAHEYNKIAQDLCSQWYSDIPPIKGEDGLAFLPFDTEEGNEYIAAMNFALSFAQENRSRMMSAVKVAFSNIYPVGFVDEVNIHHNYAVMENHFGHNVMVHRKGATSAKEGQYGIIPGSQGTSSFIVKGKGNEESFKSCSHGAGRKMSRSKACKELNLEDEKRKLDEQGIVHSIRNIKDLDEASGAYKDINLVMKEQEDLVEIVVELNPLAVIKGT